MRTVREKLEIRIPGCEADIAVWLVLLDRSVILWVGDANGSLPAMPQLAVGMPGLRGGTPTSRTLLDETDAAGDDYAESLSRRLSQRGGVQVFASEALRPEWKSDDLLMHVLEKKLSTFVIEQCTPPAENA